MSTRRSPRSTAAPAAAAAPAAPRSKAKAKAKRTASPHDDEEDDAPPTKKAASKSKVAPAVAAAAAASSSHDSSSMLEGEASNGSSTSLDPSFVTDFFTKLVNPEQRRAWEITSGSGKTKDERKPPHHHTFVWQLKPTEQCKKLHWTTSPATRVEEALSVRPTTLEPIQSFSSRAADGGDRELDPYDVRPAATHMKEQPEAKGKKGKAPPLMVRKAVRCPPGPSKVKPFASKVGGWPFLQDTRPSEAWPTCNGCGNSLPFLFQLLLSDMPENLGHAYHLPSVPLDKQLLQVFCCASKDCDSPTPYHHSQFVRLLDISSYSISTYAQASSSAPIFDEQLVVGWVKKRDYPHPSDWSKYGLGDYTGEGKEDALVELYEPICGEKLSGFPHFRQDSEYWKCSQCSKEMHFVFQVNGGPFKGGPDSNLATCGGQGHVMQCPDHPEVLAFGWHTW